MRRLNATAPRRPTVRAGVSRSQLPESATTIASAARRSWKRSRIAGSEREPNSSSPSANRTMPTSGSASTVSQGADGADVRHHAGLVVGGPAPVEAVAAQGRLVGLRLPVVVVARRLHVVVGVQQHGRAAVARGAGGDAPRAARARPLAGIGSRTIVDVVEDARCREPARRPLGARDDVLGVEAVPRDRRDAHQVRQLGDRGRQAGLHRLAEVVGVRAGGGRRVGVVVLGHGMIFQHDSEDPPWQDPPATRRRRPTPMRRRPDQGTRDPHPQRAGGGAQAPAGPDRPSARRPPVARSQVRRRATGPASAWPRARRSTSRCATRARRSATCATTSTRA